MHTTSFTRLAGLALALSLTACASDTSKRMGSAATTPLADLNVVRADIPAVLEDAQKQPYLMPKDPGCVGLALEIGKLDEVLGADLDTPASDKHPSLLDRASTLANDGAVSAVQRTAEDLIPFRGWVRKLSGAERYSKRVAASITAGSIRRAFLKGIAVSKECVWSKATPPTEKAAAAAPAAQG